MYSGIGQNKIQFTSWKLTTKISTFFCWKRDKGTQSVPVTYHFYFHFSAVAFDLFKVTSSVSSHVNNATIYYLASQNKVELTSC